MANFKVYTYHKKSCEEHEHYHKDGMTIIRKTGFRWANFNVETTDDNPPEFEFEVMPNGTDDADSINMYSPSGPNISDVELDSMTDGCWEEFVWPDEMDEDERARLEELIEEHGSYEALEEMEGWMLNDSEAWCWGPIAIENDNGELVKIVVADEDGDTVEYEEDE